MGFGVIQWIGSTKHHVRFWLVMLVKCNRRLDANIDLRATQFHELIVEAIHRRGMRGVLWRYGYYCTFEQLNFFSSKKSGVYQPLELISGE